MEKKENNLLIVLISMISILYASKSQSLASESITNKNEGKITISKTDSNELNLPDYAKDVLRVFPEWEVIQFDEKPSLKVNGYDGYRLVLRQSRKEYIDTFQQRPSDPNAYNNLKYSMKYNHIDLVIFKNDELLPDYFIEKIPWLELKQEQFTKPVSMGTGKGFKWFVNTTLYYQEYLRKELGLEGGDDRIELLTQGLFIKDEGTCTPNSVILLTSEFGDKTVESIERAVKTNIDKDPWYAILALHTIPSQKCTELLKQYYHSKDKRIRDAAAYSLIHKPLRIAVKQEYLDMLAHQKYTDEIAKACIEFNWKEAIPIFENICSKPEYWRNYYIAFTSKRSLEGRPISEEIFKAQETMRNFAFSSEINNKEILTTAKKIIIEYQDKEAVAVIAFNLVEFNTKASSDTVINQVRDIGWDILKTLPKTETTKLYKILDKSLESSQDRDLLHKFHEIIN
jgi:hypothetical protein